jgi:hypothetical protein
LSESWDNDAYNGSVGPTSKIQAGMSIELEDVGSDGEISLVWQSSTGESSSTLNTWTGPDA